MTNFYEFVAELGDFANQYTEAQLHQLHRDVHEFAEILLAIGRKTLRTRVEELKAAADGSCQSVRNALLQEPTDLEYAEGNTNDRED